MFRAELEKKLKEIFGVAVSFNEPGESHEQNILFVEINSATERITKGQAYARVEARIYMFAQPSALPFGFFAKRIQAAARATTQPFFFFDVDTIVGNSPARMLNLSEVMARFVYLHSSQYDPNHGTMPEPEWSEEFTLNPLDSGDGRVIQSGDGQSIGVNK